VDESWMNESHMRTLRLCPVLGIAAKISVPLKGDFRPHVMSGQLWKFVMLGKTKCENLWLGCEFAFQFAWLLIRSSKTECGNEDKPMINVF